MTSYWLIKLILLILLLGIGYWIMRPVHSQSHLAMRRLGMLALVVFSAFAVLSPNTLNRLAQSVGVSQGVNLLLYVLFVAFFAQVVTAYRREVAMEKKLTNLARAIAIQNVKEPLSADESDED